MKRVLSFDSGGQNDLWMNGCDVFMELLCFFQDVQGGGRKQSMLYSLPPNVDERKS